MGCGVLLVLEDMENHWYFGMLLNIAIVECCVCIIVILGCGLTIGIVGCGSPLVLWDADVVEH